VQLNDANATKGMYVMKRAIAVFLGSLALLLSAPMARAGPIGLGIWYEFATALATGCSPADPGGSICIPSSGTPTVFADAPPYTFVAPSTGGALTVTDAFDSGDILDVFDFGALIGTTSPSVFGTGCGDDPVPCLADPLQSHGIFALGAGAHSIAFIESATASSPGGAHYFRVDAAAAVVPAPPTFGLVLLGLAALGITRRRRTTA
jgi:hypothetical protein